jgi:hypothetical protein
MRFEIDTEPYRSHVLASDVVEIASIVSSSVVDPIESDIIVSSSQKEFVVDWVKDGLLLVSRLQQEK